MGKAIALPNSRRMSQMSFGDAPAHIRAAREAGVLGISDVEKQRRDTQRELAANRLATALQESLETDAPPYSGMPSSLERSTDMDADIRSEQSELDTEAAALQALGELGLFTLVELSIEEPVSV
jgi:hypothetical protein